MSHIMNSSTAAKYLLTILFLCNFSFIQANTNAKFITGFPDSALSIAAASMEVGESMIFDTIGFDYDLVNACGASTFIVDWARDAVWNSFNQEIHFIGQGHYACQKHIKYLENDNTWYEVSRADWEDVGIRHAYEHNTIDTGTGAFYYGRYNSKSIKKYLNGNWTTLPSFPGPRAITRAIEYFPEMNGLVVLDSQAGILLFNEITDEWSVLSGPVEMGAYHVFAEYSPVHKVIIFGGGNGSTKVNKLTADGTVDTNIADSPVVLGVASNQGLVQVDTSTGNFLAFLDNNTQYEYDVASDSWSFFDDENISISSTISVVIPEYDVILFASRSGVTLYKLGDSSGLTSVTLDTSSILVNSGETTTLSWNSSNTNSCEASGGWSGSRATSGSESSPAITNSTTFTLTCTGVTGISSDSVTINVVNTDPVVSLSASSTLVDSGDTITLSWDSINTNSCLASGGWSGTRGVSGSETSPAITTTTNFVLTCSGDTGSSSDTVTVSIDNGGVISLGSGLIITNALVYDANNGSDWSISANLQIANSMYGDRSFRFSQIPANLIGQEWLSTANDSKSFVGEKLVEFSVAVNAEVFILHRDDISNKPNWLSSWVDTGNDVINDEPKTYSIFSRSFNAGEQVSLGSNGSATSGMYIVVVVATQTSELIFTSGFE
ncbi:MAG: hypothetical protein L3J24_05640 [Xanthomonadales bacterium]|nr:hypothetical protein [Xanthomonadales bacterium]